MKKIAALALLGTTLAGCQTAYVEQPVYVQPRPYYNGYVYPRTYYQPPAPVYYGCRKTKIYTPNGVYMKKTCG